MARRAQAAARAGDGDGIASGGAGNSPRRYFGCSASLATPGPCVDFDALYAAIRDQKIDRASARAQVRELLPRIRDDFYAHGGKDGTPHPVDRPTYDRSIHVLTEAVRKSRVGNSEKTDALKRLATFSRS